MSGTTSDGTSLLRQFHYFQILYPVARDIKTHQCTHIVPALFSGCPGIKVQALQLFVKHDFEDM